MKKSLFSLIAVLALTLSAYGQSVNVTNPIVGLQTNLSGNPFLSGPLIDALSTLSTVTNWAVFGGGIYTASTPGHNQGSGGAFLGVMYNFNEYIGTGLWFDWLDRNGITVPSGQIQFGAPFVIGGTNGVLFRPFGFTGVGVPIAGMGNDNGTVQGIFGAGLGVKVYGGLNVFGGIEDRTGMPSPWYFGGLAWSKWF